MPPLPRGTCPFCGAEVALRKGGLVREHKTPGGINVRGMCPGSGRAAGSVDDPVGGMESQYPEDAPEDHLDELPPA